MDAGVVRKSVGGPLVDLGVGGFLLGWPIAVFVITLILLIVLFVRHVKGAILISIVTGTVLAVIAQTVLNITAPTSAKNPTGWALNVPSLPNSTSSPHPT